MAFIYRIKDTGFSNAALGLHQSKSSLLCLILGRECWNCPSKLFFKGLCIVPLVTPSDLARVKLRFDSLSCQCMRNLAWALYYSSVYANVYSCARLWLHSLPSLQVLRGNTVCSIEYHYLICQLLSVEECTSWFCTHNLPTSSQAGTRVQKELVSIKTGWRLTPMSTPSYVCPFFPLLGTWMWNVDLRTHRNILFQRLWVHEVQPLHSVALACVLTM